MDNDQSTLQDRVKRYIADNGLQKKWFATQINTSKSGLSNWFAGRYTFAPDRIEKVKQLISE